MSFFENKSAIAQDFISLKTRVKNEMNRRNGYGSLTAYAAAAYDYSTVPKADKPINIEHYSKIRDVMVNINPSRVGLGAKRADEAIQSMSILEANITSFEAQPRGAISSNDCANACSGMCVSQCTTTCSGCSGCSGSCSGSCSSCSGTCSGGCTGCGSTCTGCSGTCTYTCMNSCTNGLC